MNTLSLVIIWSLIGGVVSLLGAIALSKVAQKQQNYARLALPFGAGALIAVAFTDLLPEALEGVEAHGILPWTLAGFLLFFILERTVHWFHHHHGHGEGLEGRHNAQKSLIIFGDTLHNLIDGLAIGAAFLIDTPTGIVTSLAVAAHEIPQEIGDFGFLLSRGMTIKGAIVANLISSLATVVGAVTIYLIGSVQEISLAPLLAITAGFFIYIAASDIIPDIHERPHREANIQAGILLLGVLLMVVLASTLHA